MTAEDEALAAVAPIQRMPAQNQLGSAPRESASAVMREIEVEGAVFSIAQRKPNSDSFCASRNLNSYEHFPDEALRANPNVHQWVEAEQVLPISAVHWIWTAGWKVGPRVLNDSMWFWFEKIDGWAKMGGHKYPLLPGTLLLIPRGTEHEIVHERGEARVFAVHFQATVYGGVNPLELLGYPHCISGVQHRAFFSENSQRLAKEFAVKSPGWTRAMSVLITEVLLHILRFESGSFHAPGASEMQAELPRLLPALTWMHDHLSDPDARIADMAAAVNICESRFRKLFTKSMGLSPVQFMQRQRIERASSLLSATDDSIEHIAQQSGFADLPFFYRTFKAWTTTSPGKYRRLVKSGKVR